MRRRLLGWVFLAALTALLLVPFHPEALLVAAAETAGGRDPGARWVIWNVLESGGNLGAFALAAAAVFAITGRWWLAALLGTALSAAAELAQALIPGRVASLADLLTNAVGALLGAAVCELLARRRRRRPAAA